MCEFTVPHATEDEPEKDGDRPELQVPFNEQDFLRGKIPLLGGEAKPREPTGKVIHHLINNLYSTV